MQKGTFAFDICNWKDSWCNNDDGDDDDDDGDDDDDVA